MVSLDAVIAMDLVLLPVMVPLVIARQWVLRYRTPTVASVVSDVSFIFFTLISQVIGGIDVRNSYVEKNLRRRYTDEEDVSKRLVTTTFLKLNFAALLLYTIQLWFLKTAYLGYFFGFRAHLTKWPRRLLIGTSVYCAASFIVVIAFQLGWCHPLSLSWRVGPGSCVSISTVPGSTVQAWLSISTDLLIMLLAILAVMQLQLGSGERIALIFVILIGSVSPAMSTLRFVKVYQSAIHSGQASLPVVRQLLLWGKFEVVSAHYAFCLPAFRVFYRQCTGKIAKMNLKQNETTYTATTENPHSGPGSPGVFDSYHSLGSRSSTVFRKPGDHEEQVIGLAMTDLSEVKVWGQNQTIC